MGRESVGRTTATQEKRSDAKPMRIGPDAMNFDWGDHRKTRWTRFCSEILGGELYATALTALLNLDWRHSTSEAAIPDIDLTTGWSRHVWPLLTEIRPRIVCTLTVRVWDTILPTIEEHRQPLPKCPVKLGREPIAFNLPGWNFLTLLVKPHNHPSRFLSNDQVVQFGKGCGWLLNRVF